MSTTPPPRSQAPQSPYDQPPEHGGRGALAERLSSPKVFIGGIITIAAIWFIIANNSRVRIHLWLTWVSARLWMVLLLTFVAGALVGYLFARRRARRRE